jgi:hypothetical protein
MKQKRDAAKGIVLLFCTRWVYLRRLPNLTPPESAERQQSRVLSAGEFGGSQLWLADNVSPRYCIADKRRTSNSGRTSISWCHGCQASTPKFCYRSGTYLHPPVTNVRKNLHRKASFALCIVVVVIPWQRRLLYRNQHPLAQASRLTDYHSIIRCQMLQGSSYGALYAILAIDTLRDWVVGFIRTEGLSLDACVLNSWTKRQSLSRLY